MRVIAVALGGLGCACTALDVDDCAIRCERSCPSALDCRAGFCVHPGFAGSCETVSKVPGDAGSDARPADAGVDAGAALDGGAPATFFAGPCELSGALRVEPCPLPPACLGVPYGTALQAAGGQAPYLWTASSTPTGLTLSSDGRLSGVAREPGQLSFVVSDRSGQTSRGRIFMPARSSCWFAHATAGPTTRLELFDPLFSDGASSVVRVPSDEEASANVQAFEFSPNGRFLSVLFEGTDVTSQLRLFAAPDWRAVPFEITESGRLLHHAWSPDGSVLALALEREAGQVLGGLRLVPADVASERAPVVTSLAFEAARADFELEWFAGHRVVLVGLGPDADPESRLLFDTALEGDAFGVVTAYGFSSYASSLRLAPGPDGFFAIVQFMNLPPVIDYYAPGPAGSSPIVHRNDAVPSPTRRHAAHVAEAGELRVYAAGERRPSADDDASPLPLGIGAGCGKLLAWSPGGEELMCVSDASGAGVLRRFALDGLSPALSPLAAVEGSYVYSPAASALRRRAYSPRRSWFAFTTTERELYVAELNGERGSVTRPATFLIDQDTNAALEFAPDDTHLLHQGAGTLWLRHLVPSDGDDVALSGSLPAPLECSEVGAATSWCGSPGGAGAFSWSPDSRAIAYRVLEGVPIVVRDVDSHGLRAIACGPGCEDFAFQP
jgi:hypothetical protein